MSRRSQQIWCLMANRRLSRVCALRQLSVLTSGVDCDFKAVVGHPPTHIPQWWGLSLNCPDLRCLCPGPFANGGIMSTSPSTGMCSFHSDEKTLWDCGLWSAPCDCHVSHSHRCFFISCCPALGPATSGVGGVPTVGSFLHRRHQRPDDQGPGQVLGHGQHEGEALCEGEAQGQHAELAADHH